jgi:hypothetical protein
MMKKETVLVHDRAEPFHPGPAYMKTGISLGEPHAGGVPEHLVTHAATGLVYIDY